MRARFPALLAAGFVVAMALPATGAEFRPPQDSGFYGGIALRQSGAESSGITFGALAPEWSRYATSTMDDSGARALMYGGYRWRNDLSVEAAFESSERYALRRTDALGRSGVGLAVPGLAAPDASARAWNVDVYGSWSFWRSFSLYGRMGYAQADVSVTPIDPRRAREGVNYGVGVRYDMSRTLGLKLEYARFGHPFSDTVGTSLPESDQLQLGLQYRF
jgi:opacity protein-like surface antigen